MKKTMALYIDCTKRKTFVTELRKFNKLVDRNEQEGQKREMCIEVDIDSVEMLFDNDFFDYNINNASIEQKNSNHNL